MFRIKLINAPFSDLCIPSIALTQLKGVAEARFGDRIRVDIHYLNHDFATYLSPEIYRFMAGSSESTLSGFGEWFFRGAAFPGEADNTRAFFDRYGVHFGAENLQIYEQVIKDKRQALSQFIDELIRRYQLDRADLVGFTSMFFQTLASCALALRLKQKNPDVTTVLGGANCEAPMGQALSQQFPCMDYVFSGHALVSFPRLLDLLLDGKDEDISNIRGVFSKRTPETLARKNGSGIGEELPIDTQLPSLDYDSFLESYQDHFPHAPQKPYLLFETSRGCWWGARSHCTFCGLNGGTMHYRSMPPQKALNLLHDLFERYGARVDHFSSVDNIIPKDYLSEVFPNLKVPANVSLFYEVKADLTRAEMKTLAAAHVYDIQPGIESLNTGTLKLMRKGTTAFNNINFLKYAVLYGIFPSWNLLMGFPGETHQVFEKYLRDLPNLFHLPPPSDAVTVRFDRYSPYFTGADAYGLELRPLDFYALSFPFELSVLKQLAYFFEDGRYDAPYIKDVSKYLTPVRQTVDRWQALWRGGGRPELYFKDRHFSNAIADSRDGEPRSYRISDVAKDVLLALDRPRTPAGLAQLIDEWSPAEIEAGIEEVKDRELVFCEGKSLMNIVFPHKPVRTARKSYHL